MIETTTKKQNKYYTAAYEIKLSKYGHFLYCLEDDKFYHYNKGYWESLFEIDFLGRLQESIFNLTCLPLSSRKQIVDNFKYLGRKHLSEFNWANLINLQNGMISPFDGILIDHEPNFYSTIRLPYIYDENAKCELWIKVINEILENDIDKINTLQEYFGYCLTKDTNQIMALLLLGESKSGKSTILHVLRNVIGIQNCSSVAMKFISNPQYTPMLINKLVNIDPDVSENAKDFEFEFKIITSGEPISCNQKFVPTFEFIPHCKIVMAANRFPRVTDHSSAFYNRLQVIPCERVFSPNEQDRNLKINLLKELPGILLWSMDGLRRLNKRGRFEDRKFIKEALEDLREESNPIEAFFRGHIEADIKADYQIEKGELYDKYTAWCRLNGNMSLSSIKFGQAIYQKYSKFTPKKSQCHLTGKRLWKNIRYIDHKLKETIKEDLQWQ